MEQKSYEPTAAFNPPLMDFFAKSFQSCLTLCDPMDCSLLSSSVHGIFHAKILECVKLIPTTSAYTGMTQNSHTQETAWQRCESSTAPWRDSRAAEKGFIKIT